jgi:hypothetical protein
MEILSFSIDSPRGTPQFHFIFDFNRVQNMINSFDWRP